MPRRFAYCRLPPGAWPACRAVRYLPNLGSRGGPSLRDYRFWLTVDEARRDGTAEILCPKLQQTKAVYERLIPAARSFTQDDGGQSDFHSARIESGSLARELMTWTKQPGTTKSDKTFAKATISGHIKRAQQFFSVAVKACYIAYSPFADIVAGSQVNDARNAYISADDVELVIDKASDAEWRLIVALGRYAGLRIPSEALRLEWTDIDWQRNRIIVR